VEYIDGYIYLFNTTRNVYAYHIASDSWSARTASPMAGYTGLSSIVFQDEIYISGYTDSSFYKYTPSSDQWTKLANTPNQVVSCAMMLMNDFIYCVGGNNAAGAMFQSTIVYDILNDTWTVDQYQTSRKRHWMAPAEYQGSYFILGGLDSTSFAVDLVEEIIPGGFVGIGKAVASPSHFSLDQNYPNPFNPTTTISYQLLKAGQINLEILNLSGQRLATLVNEWQGPGNHKIQWDAQNMASGIYFYRLEFQDNIQIKRMVLLR
jgi:hypothetical protein